MSPLTPARANTSKGVCVYGESKSQTKFPFYQFIKQAKQSKYYGDWYKLIHSHVEAKMTTNVLECILRTMFVNSSKYKAISIR